MSKCNEIIHAAYTAIKENKPIDDIIPYDLSCFTDEEREKFSILLDHGFIDTFRYFYPDTEGVYSWWSYRFQARAKNAGWRIDYFLISDCLKDNLKGAHIHTDILGSDHCPVECTLEF
jgi:exodeoxyribonuclease-3